MNIQEINSKIIETRQSLSVMKEKTEKVEFLEQYIVLHIIDTLDFVLKTIHKELKQLNEESVKRNELIEFSRWLSGNYPGMEITQHEFVVNSFLNSINEAKRN
jgi:hypothetical protein